MEFSWVYSLRSTVGDMFLQSISGMPCLSTMACCENLVGSSEERPCEQMLQDSSTGEVFFLGGGDF